MKGLLIIASTLIVVNFAFSQQRWERVFGGAGRDQAFAVVQTQDGGYAIAGFTGSFGPGCYSPYLITTDAWGDTVWSRCYGGPNNDYCWSMQQTRDGGFILAGAIDSIFQTGPHDVYLVKTDTQGDTLWSRVYGDTGKVGNKNDMGKDVQQTLDNGYIVVGLTNSYGAGGLDIYLIKTNASGDTLWTRTYGGASDDYGQSVQQTSDGGYIIAGSTSSFGAGGSDVYLIKTNASGDTLWTRTYGGTNADFGRSVQQTSDSGYIIAGTTWSYGAGRTDVYLINTDAQGNPLWTKTFGGLYSDEGSSVQQTAEGGYIVAGLWKPSNAPGAGSVYLIKTNAQGDSLWSSLFTGLGGANGESVRQTQDGGYIIGGLTWGGLEDDYYLIKTDSRGSTGVEENQESGRMRAEGRMRPAPNPFLSFASVAGHERERFSLYDVSGRRVGIYKGDRIGEGLSPGVYFLRPESGSSKPLRIVKVR